MEAKLKLRFSLEVQDVVQILRRLVEITEIIYFFTEIP